MRYIVINFLIIFFASILFYGCYTINVPSGAYTPLITEQGENKISVNGNFNELGGNFTYALTDHTLFTASGNFHLINNDYKQDYDSVFYKKTPNNFEIGFGYFGGKNKFANMFMFGVGTGNMFYDEPIGNINYNGYTNGYYQINFVQYYLQYTAGFKYRKRKKRELKNIEQGLSFRYAYHDYNVIGISEKHIISEEWNETGNNWNYNENIINEELEEINYFHSFSTYYFFRKGNDKVQFELSPGITIYNNKPKYLNYSTWTSELHFTVSAVFNINKLISR